MILGPGYGLRLGTVANSKLAGPATQKRPSCDAEILSEAQLLTIELPRYVKIVDGKYERRCRNIRHLPCLATPDSDLADCDHRRLLAAAGAAHHDLRAQRLSADLLLA